MQKNPRPHARVRLLPPDTERALVPLSEPMAAPSPLRGNSRLLWELLARSAPAPMLPVELATEYRSARHNAPRRGALPRSKVGYTLDQNITALNGAADWLNAELQRAGLPYRVALCFALVKPRNV